MAMLGIDFLIAVWLLIFVPMLLLPLIRREDDHPVTDETGRLRRSTDEPIDAREAAAILSDRDLSQAA